MFLSYFDESGDDGYPKMSSELFVLSSIYMQESSWKDNYEKLLQLRRELKSKYSLLVKEEFHTKEFITDKNPYHKRFSHSQRRDLIFDMCRGVSTLDMKSIIVVIDKQNINRPKYDVLKNALTYNIQRIENDLNFLGGDARFMIITDEGRVAAMRNTTRLIQRMNYIPSMYGGTPLRKDIKKLVEDPLPKNSNDSYFIQVADLLAFLMMIYSRRFICKPSIELGKRIRNVLSDADIISILDILKPILNLKASRKNPYGVVYYP